MIYLGSNYQWDIEQNSRITRGRMHHWRNKMVRVDYNDYNRPPSNFVMMQNADLSFSWEGRPQPGHTYAVVDGMGFAKIDKWCDDNNVEPLSVSNLDIYKARNSHPGLDHMLFEFGTDDAGILFKLTWSN